MRALVKAEPREGMEIKDVPQPEPGPDEVKLRVGSVGIDGGAEALIYDWDESWHHLAEELPRIFGHEFGGTVETVGENVTRCAPGDRVAVEPGDTCGTCRNCMAGEPNICENREIIGIERDGALAEYVVVPERNIYHIPDSVSFDEAAFLELLALGVNALEYSNFKAGDDVAITGPGPVGLGTLIAVVAGGANTVDVIGAPIDTETRLPAAKEMGATRTYNIESDELEHEVDVFFEASGHLSGLEEAVTKTRRGGQIVQIGIFHDADAVPVDLNHLVRNGIAYRPMRARRNSSWRRAIKIAKKIDMSPVIGPRFDICEYKEAFDVTKKREGVKITLRP